MDPDGASNTSSHPLPPPVDTPNLSRPGVVGAAPKPPGAPLTLYATGALVTPIGLRACGCLFVFVLVFVAIAVCAVRYQQGKA